MLQWLWNRLDDIYKSRERERRASRIGEDVDHEFVCDGTNEWDARYKYRLMYPEKGGNDHDRSVRTRQRY